jgi:uncharacterized protein
MHIPTKRAAPAAPLLCAAVLLGGSAVAATPSFLCSKAKTWVETTICASERLSELDLELATVYARLLRVASDSAAGALTADQRRWWAARNDCRKQPDPPQCLDTRYVERIAALRSRPDYSEARPGPVVLPPEAISAAGEGWTRSLSLYIKAIRACLRKAPAAVAWIGSAWEDPGEEQTVGIRLRGANGERWVCTARRNGSEVLGFQSANEYQDLPPEGPLFYPDPTAAPSGACGQPVQVLDEYEAPVGWVGRACEPAAPQAKPAPDG